MSYRVSERLCKGNNAAHVKINMPHGDLGCTEDWPYIDCVVGLLANRKDEKDLTRGDIRRYYPYNRLPQTQEEVLMAKRRNPKIESLRNQGTLNVHPEQVRDELFLGHDFFDPSDLLQVKYEMLRKRRVEGASVTRAAEVFGFSRPSFYQALEAFEAEGLSGLIPHRRGPKQAHKLTGPGRPAPR